MTTLFLWQEHLAEIDKRGVRKVFTPATPVRQIQSLFGRQAELMRIHSSVDTPGRHVLIYGDRGVGKSSLVKVLPLLLDNKQTLKDIYDGATRSDTNETFKRTVNAAAELDTNEFSIADVRRQYLSLYSEDLTAGNCSAAFKRFLGINGSNILHRISRGVYRFTDPRMPSYARMRYRASKG